MNKIKGWHSDLAAGDSALHTIKTEILYKIVLTRQEGLIHQFGTCLCYCNICVCEKISLCEVLFILPLKNCTFCFWRCNELVFALIVNKHNCVEKASVLLLDSHDLSIKTVFSPSCQNKLIILCKLNVIHKAKQPPPPEKFLRFKRSRWKLFS